MKLSENIGFIYISDEFENGPDNSYFIKVAEKLYGHKISVKFDNELNHTINARIIALYFHDIFLVNTLEVTFFRFYESWS